MATAAENRETKEVAHPHPHHHRQARGPLLSSLPRYELVDRENTCPLLLRVFTKMECHHTQEDFAVRGKEPKEEGQIHTWTDATLAELADLVKEVVPAARKSDAKLSFAFVYPNSRGRYTLREVGMTRSNGQGTNANKKLAELGFEVGDYLDIAIM